MTKIAFMTNPAIRQIKLIIFGLVTFGTVSCNTETKNSVVKAERISPGYNELANSEKRKSFLISDFNTDNPDIENIPRPTTSALHTKLDTSLLFGIWTSDPNGPHADFQLTRKSFYVVDYDGNGDMPYQLNDSTLKVYYNDFIQEGKIISVDRDTLKIIWKGFDRSNSFVRWSK
jgi:hypothetical protein